jgi:hypothetical protein
MAAIKGRSLRLNLLKHAYRISPQSTKLASGRRIRRSEGERSQTTAEFAAVAAVGVGIAIALFLGFAPSLQDATTTLGDNIRRLDPSLGGGGGGLQTPTPTQTPTPAPIP